MFEDPQVIAASKRRQPSVVSAGTAVSVADTDDNKCAVLEIYRPTNRYVRPVVTRATQNATIDSIVAILFNGRVSPVALDTSLVAASKVVASPALGTP